MNELFVSISTDTHKNVHVKCFRKNNFIARSNNKLVLKKDGIRYHIVIVSKRSFSIDEIKGIMRRYHEIWGIREVKQA